MDSSLKVAAHPTLGASNAAWVQDFCFKVGQDFARELKTKSDAATLIVSANNGAGDTNGVSAAFVITLTTA
jgi:hypothetical protein